MINSGFDDLPEHPVDEYGRAVIPAGISLDCLKEECTQRRCRRDRQHVYHPKADYKTSLEKRFRTLDCFVIEMCRSQHEMWDNGIQPPAKPSHDVMWQTINERRAGTYDIAFEEDGFTEPVIKHRMRGE